MKGVCQCCGVFQSVEVFCSALGPISIAYCKRCIQFGAEPEWLVKSVLEDTGGWENVADWVRDVIVPAGPGVYVFADQIL